MRGCTYIDSGCSTIVRCRARIVVMLAVRRRTATQSHSCDNSRSRGLDFEQFSRTGNKRRNALAGDTVLLATSRADRWQAADYGTVHVVPLNRAQSLPPVGSRRQPVLLLRQGGVVERESESLAATRLKHDSEESTWCWSATEHFHTDELDDCMTCHPSLLTVTKKQHNANNIVQYNYMHKFEKELAKPICYILQRYVNNEELFLCIKI